MINDWEYPLKTKESVVKWELISSNPLQYIIDNEKLNEGLVVGGIKKIFGATPISIRNQTNDNAIYLRPLTLWLLVNKTDVNLNEISCSFHISLDELNSYRDNDEVKDKYWAEIQKFYAPMVDDYLSNTYSNLVLCDFLLKHIDELETVT